MVWGIPQIFQSGHAHRDFRWVDIILSLMLKDIWSGEWR